VLFHAASLLVTKNDETIDPDVIFVGHVDVSGLTVLSDEDGILTHGVKQVGQFQIRGTKVNPVVAFIGIGPLKTTFCFSVHLIELNIFFLFLIAVLLKNSMS
jgi:hypothetical protein